MKLCPGFCEYILILFLHFADINECASNPCKNNGKCKDGINKYTCDCHVSYKGSTCQTRKGKIHHENMSI